MILCELNTLIYAKNILVYRESLTYIDIVWGTILEWYRIDTISGKYGSFAMFIHYIKYQAN